MNLSTFSDLLLVEGCVLPVKDQFQLLYVVCISHHHSVVMDTHPQISDCSSATQPVNSKIFSVVCICWV